MINIKSADEIKKMRISGRIAAQILAELGKMVREGITTQELENAAIALIKETGSESAFKGYHGYPAHICVSINDVVVHGIPGGQVLKEGDIVAIDVGVINKGYYGDTAATFSVGEIKAEHKKLVEVTRLALENGIAMARKGNRLSDISHAVQIAAENDGFSVVRDFVGHGIGTQMHEDPQIPNFGQPHKGPVLKAGMTLAIEPMVNSGGYRVFVADDGWTVRTKDKGYSAHFEHTIAITDNDPEVITILD